MSESELRYASEIVIGITSEHFLKRKDELVRELAVLSFKLNKLKERACETPPALTIMVRAKSIVWRDDGYTGGDVTRTSTPLKITASYFLTAYLGAVAKEPHDGDRSEISFDGIDIGEEEFEYPRNEVRDAFFAVQDEAEEIISAMSKDIQGVNLYKDIPIKINQFELQEALLRIEILKYCDANDEYFSIEELNNN